MIIAPVPVRQPLDPTLFALRSGKYIASPQTGLDGEGGLELVLCMDFGSTSRVLGYNAVVGDFELVQKRPTGCFGADTITLDVARDAQRHVRVQWWP